MGRVDTQTPTNPERQRAPKGHFVQYMQHAPAIHVLRLSSASDYCTQYVGRVALAMTLAIGELRLLAPSDFS